MFSKILLLAIVVISFSSALIPQQKHATFIVTMKGMKFVPNKIEVSTGDTVIWMNESGGDHNVVSNDGTFKSSMLEKGQFYALVFEKKGQYKYYCQPHRIMGMKGIVDVK